MLIDCHAHSSRSRRCGASRTPSKPPYVTAEPVALRRMLDEHDRVGITHAVVSDSFFMESARDALPAWSSVDRASSSTTAWSSWSGGTPGGSSGWAASTRSAARQSARELERLTRDLGLYGVLINPSLGEGYLDAPGGRAVPGGGRGARRAALPPPIARPAGPGGLARVRPERQPGPAAPDGHLHRADDLRRHVRPSPGSEDCCWRTPAAPCRSWPAGSTPPGRGIGPADGTARTS